jgi:tRNA 2-thiouridine synthesizing protein A
MIEVDARGFSCPVPVVKSRKAMEDNPKEKVSVLVETIVSKENITRLARNAGYEVEVEEVGDEYRLVLTPPRK